MENPIIIVNQDGKEIVRYGLWEMVILLVEEKRLENWMGVKICLNGEEITPPKYLFPEPTKDIILPKARRESKK